MSVLNPSFFPLEDLPEKITAEDADFLLLQNATGETYKITKANFLAGLPSGTHTIPTKLSGTTFGASPFWQGNSAYSFNSAFDGDISTIYN